MMVDGPTFVGDDGYVYVVGKITGQTAEVHRLWLAEHQRPGEWWCSICFQNRGDGVAVPCGHYGGMTPPKQLPAVAVMAAVIDTIKEGP